MKTMPEQPKEKATKKSRPQPEQIQPVEGVKKEELKAFIEEQVITKLGKPKNLNFIKASNIFDNRWRVDVWCYFDSTETIVATKCSKIYYSYFIHADDDGKITKSNPEIVKEH